MRTSFAALPDSLEESAKLDGAGAIRILVSIVIPLSMPVIAVMILYYAVGHWNAWFDASIYIKEREKFPLQLILREILIINDTNSMTQGSGDASDQMAIGETVKYAVIVVSTLPILCVYPFLQKYFQKGVMIGAVKG
jgi:putative aldouronate transport system permease protein